MLPATGGFKLVTLLRYTSMQSAPFHEREFPHRDGRVQDPLIMALKRGNFAIWKHFIQTLSCNDIWSKIAVG